jgi:hypothetical protein
MAPRPFEFWFGVGKPDGNHSMGWKVWGLGRQPTLCRHAIDGRSNEGKPPRKWETACGAYLRVRSVR